MSVNVQALNASLVALTDEVARTEGLVPSIVRALAGQAEAIKRAVEEALTADGAANQGSIDAANAAIVEVTARFTAASTELGNAVANNPGNNPNPANPPNPADQPSFSRPENPPRPE